MRQFSFVMFGLSPSVRSIRFVLVVARRAIRSVLSSAALASVLFGLLGR